MDALFYVTDGVWGSGLGRPLHAFEFDGNNYTIAQAIAALEAAMPGAARGIESIVPSGNDLLITYTDATTDTVPIPTTEINFRNAWLPGVDYAAFTDFFTAEGAFWQVIFPHTSDTTFDPGANNGLGDNYYKMVLQFPAVPVKTRTGTTFTFTPSDANSYNRFTNAGGCVITIADADFIDDTEITCAVKGGGTLSVVGETTNVVILAPFGFSSASAIEGAVFTLKYCGVTGGVHTWDIFGLLSPSGVVLGGLFVDSDTFHAPTVS